MAHPTPFLGLLALSALAAHAQQQRPNIIYIMCDDMGYGDLACYGQKYIATPHIDRLAAQGTRFTQAYAGSPVSAPSRATLMTGQHSGHTRVRGNREYWRGKEIPNLYGRNAEVAEGWAGQEPYDTAHKILPEIFKANGYRTGMFGKWAGGYEGSVSTPDKRGIDDYFGFICQFQAHAYYPNFLNAFSRSASDTATRRVVLEENIKYGMPGSEDYLKRPQYSADLIHQKALAWLDKQEPGKPFLGIFTYTLPHAELQQPHDSILSAYLHHFSPERRYPSIVGSRYHGTNDAHAQFAAMITRLDIMVGDIMAKLRAKGLDDNTIVVFTSDNGPHEEGGADPIFFNRDGLLRGTKRSTHEGGIRIPFIVRWPGHVPAGRVNDHQLAFYDVLPTFCELAGINDFPSAYEDAAVAEKLRNAAPQQGTAAAQHPNPSSAKKGDKSTAELQSSAKKGEKSTAAPVASSFDGLSFAPTLLGKAGQAQHDHLYWEFSETDMLGVRRGDWKLVVQRGKCRLYNLATDLHEDHDVSAEHPDIVRQLVDIIYQEHRTPEISSFKVTLPPRN